jgi:septal ring factor EnvC (AmiA/AmiB activator)
MSVIESAKKNKILIFISAASLLVVIVLSYMILSAPDRNKDIESLKLNKAQLEGQIIQIKNNNFLLEESYKKLELKTDSLMATMNLTQKKIDKLNNDLKKALEHVDQYTDTELVDFFTAHFNGK